LTALTTDKFCDPVREGRGEEATHTEIITATEFQNVKYPTDVTAIIDACLDTNMLVDESEQISSHETDSPVNPTG